MNHLDAQNPQMFHPPLQNADGILTMGYPEQGPFMPELPDLTIYLEALDARARGARLEDVRISSPFILRTAEPPVDEFRGLTCESFGRIGKRLVLGFENDHYIAIHLMIAGRLKWAERHAKVPAKVGLMAFDFDSGTLILTEASQKHRASVHLFDSAAKLAGLDAGGAELHTLDLKGFISALTERNHTLKRAMTDQHYIAGIGNAYSDEILHRARLSPMKQTSKLTEQEWQSLFDATRVVLDEWTDLLRDKAGGKFPTKVTAFHDEMAVHGKFKQPCPDCGKPVQRIRYATNECNYCAQCLNQGNLLADRSLSRLLKQDWPKRLEDLDGA